MIPCVRVKPGVTFPATTGPYTGTIAPGGFVLLAALQHCAQVIAHDITITSGSDGEHSGPDDPHHRAEAYDARTHDLPDKLLALKTIQDFLGDDRFYAFLEDPDTDNEHIHMQVRKGTVYPPPAVAPAELNMQGDT